MRRIARLLSIALAATALAAAPGAASAAGGGHGGGGSWGGGGGHWGGGGGHWGGGWHGHSHGGWGWGGVSIGVGFAPWYYPYYGYYGYPYYYGYPGYAYPPGYVVATPGAPATATAGDSTVSTQQPAMPEPVIYPRNGQSPEQTESDRRDCDRWATTQPRAMADASVFQRATVACMEARGYTVR